MKDSHRFIIANGDTKEVIVEEQQESKKQSPEKFSSGIFHNLLPEILSRKCLTLQPSYRPGNSIAQHHRAIVSSFVLQTSVHDQILHI